MVCYVWNCRFRLFENSMKIQIYTLPEYQGDFPVNHEFNSNVQNVVKILLMLNNHWMPQVSPQAIRFPRVFWFARLINFFFLTVFRKCFSQPNSAQLTLLSLLYLFDAFGVNTKPFQINVACYTRTSVSWGKYILFWKIMSRS